MPPDEFSRKTIYLHIWRLDIAACKAVELLRILSAEERARAERFVDPKIGRRFVASRAELRKVLAALTGEAPESLRFDYMEHGRPRLAQAASDLDFNLSHSDELSALAVTRNALVGIDIEKVRPVPRNVCRRFSSMEVAALAALPMNERAAGFFRCWTRKEAYAKALGDGLSRPLDSFSVSVERGSATLICDVLAPGVDAWKLADLDPAPGYVGAIACNTQGAGLRITTVRSEFL